MSELDTDDVPMPIVMIDQDANPEATVVQIGFGDRLGALIDTVKIFSRLFFEDNLNSFVVFLMLSVIGIQC